MVFGFGRIEFDGNFINLNRPWSDFQPSRRVKSQSGQADSGIEETLFSFAQWFINARLNLLDPQEKAQLQRLFEYAEDGSSFTLIRDRNLGTYIPFEGGINPSAAPRGLKTIDDTDGTFTRTDVADSAWYLDEGTGLLRLRDGADVPRFPEGKYGAGIQIDGVAVNLIDAPSGPFNSGNWVASGGTFSTNTAETKDPAGTNIADKILTTSANQTIHYNSGTPVGNDAAAGIWLKTPVGSESAVLRIDGTGAGASPDTNIVITSTWQRFNLTADTSGFTTNLRFRIEFTPNSRVFYIYGASLFDSAQFDKGTIGPTQTSSSITRNNEGLTFPSANIVNKEKMTFLLWFNPSWAFDGQSATRIFFRSGLSNSNAHVDLLITSSGDITLRMFRSGGTSNTSVTVSGSFLNQDSWNNNLGFTIDSTISNGLIIYHNGSLQATSSNSAVNISEVNTPFSIGSDLSGANSINAAIDDVLILKNVLTANKMKGIFDLGIGLGVPRNRWTVQLNDQVWNPQWLHSDVYDIPLLLKEVLT